MKSEKAHSVGRFTGSSVGRFTSSKNFAAIKRIELVRVSKMTNAEKDAHWRRMDRPGLRFQEKWDEDAFERAGRACGRKGKNDSKAKNDPNRTRKTRPVTPRTRENQTPNRASVARSNATHPRHARVYFKTLSFQPLLLSYSSSLFSHREREERIE